MNYAIRVLELAREKVRELGDVARETAIGGAVFTEVHLAEESIKQALDVLRAAEAASTQKTEKKKKKSGGAEHCANCGGLAWKCGGAKACTNPAEAPTSPATPAAKKRGRPKGARARQQQTIDDAIAPHRPTDPAPAMPSLPIGAHPLDELAGRVLEQNGAAT